MTTTAIKTTDVLLRQEVLRELDIAEQKAWDALGRYKFQMFGYWAAIWVHLNRLSGERRENPWRGLVQGARVRQLPAGIGGGE